MNYKTLTLTLLLGLATQTNLQAEEMMHHEGHEMSQTGEMSEQGAMVMTKGVITRLDEGKGKIGIKHEAIPEPQDAPHDHGLSSGRSGPAQGAQGGGCHPLSCRKPERQAHSDSHPTAINGSGSPKRSR